jgi:RHS repeat-associated protein
MACRSAKSRGRPAFRAMAFVRFCASTYSNFGSQWGYRTDPVTGMELVGARYYDPQSGRFLTRDPAGYFGGMNLY